MSIKKAGSRFLKVRMTLRDVLYISYEVPAERLRAVVPDYLTSSTMANDTAFVSVVVLQCTRVRLNLFPFINFGYYQLNIRTYVKDPVSGNNAVYFIKSGVTSKFLSLVTRMSGIPWQHINMKTGQIRHGNTNLYSAEGDWRGKYRITAEKLPGDNGQLSFFESRKEAVDFLIRPLIGFVGDNQRLGRFTIRHPEVDPGIWRLAEMDLPLLSGLSVVDKPGHPHSVFFLPTADFTIFLPPKKVGEREGRP